MNDSNMFLYYENLGDENMRINLVRIKLVDGQMLFENEVVSGVH